MMASQQAGATRSLGSAIPRVLVVDQDRLAADGLRAVTGGWDITIVASNEAALEALERARFDVIVSELRGHEIDGAVLLTDVQERYPGMVRIVLSGNPEMLTRMRAVSFAHQFLMKPTNPSELRNVIVRTISLQQLLENDAIRRLTGKVSSLPSVPRLFTTLQLKLEDPNTTAADIAEIIEKDPAMSAKTLQIVNSAYFALSRNITSVREAVALLGFRTIKNLVLAAEVFRSFSDFGQGLGLWIEGMQAHSLLTARIASSMFTDRKMADDAFMAAVLHDSGKLVLATQKPKYLKELMAKMRVQNCPMHIAEREEAGITHAEIGGYLLGLWGLPYPIVEAVALHHSPRNVEQLRFDLLAAVHIADMLANEVVQAPGNQPLDALEALEQDYLSELGVLDRLPEWRAIAAREVEGKGSRG